jgi:hypothetical protein
MQLFVIWKSGSGRDLAEAERAFRDTLDIELALLLLTRTPSGYMFHPQNRSLAASLVSRPFLEARY